MFPVDAHILPIFSSGGATLRFHREATFMFFILLMTSASLIGDLPI
jgi:hypothetical protein